MSTTTLDRSTSSDVVDVPTQQLPVAIIGGGLAGLALGVALQQRRIPFVVYEKDEELGARQQGYGMTLTYSPSGPLAQLGVLEECLARSQPSDRHWVFDGTGKIIGFFGRDLDDAILPEGSVSCRRGGNLRVPRENLREMFFRRLPEGSVRWGSSLREYKVVDGGGLKGNSACVELVFENASRETRTTERCAVLVGADGHWSTVRHLRDEHALVCFQKWSEKNSGPAYSKGPDEPEPAAKRAKTSLQPFSEDELSSDHFSPAAEDPTTTSGFVGFSSKDHEEQIHNSDTSSTRDHTRRTSMLLDDSSASSGSGTTTSGTTPPGDVSSPPAHPPQQMIPTIHRASSIGVGAIVGLSPFRHPFVERGGFYVLDGKGRRLFVMPFSNDLTMWQLSFSQEALTTSSSEQAALATATSSSEQAALATTTSSSEQEALGAPKNINSLSSAQGEQFTSSSKSRGTNTTICSTLSDLKGLANTERGKSLALALLRSSPGDLATNLGACLRLVEETEGKDIWAAELNDREVEHFFDPVRRGESTHPVEGCSDINSAKICKNISVVAKTPAYMRALQSLPVTVIGDAAHPMSMFKGQGCNQALADVIPLAEVLAKMLPKNANPTKFSAGPLRIFEREMMQRAVKLVAKSRRAARLLHRPGLLDGREAEEFVTFTCKRAKSAGVGDDDIRRALAKAGVTAAGAVGEDGAVAAGGGLVQRTRAVLDGLIAEKERLLV